MSTILENANMLSDSEEKMDSSNIEDTGTEVKEDLDVDDRPDFLDEEDSDEDDFVVTIGEIKTNLPFQKQHRTTGTVDLDANPALKDGTPIYDLDLATMEDKPWRKPGADITDYFNYGFNEETWNQYCERQRKFRQEFGTDQAAINKTILSNIQISGATQTGLNLTTFTGGRQLVNLAGGQDYNKLQQNKMQKIVVDLSKPPPIMTPATETSLLGNPIPLMRTVISETGIITRQESSSELKSTHQAESIAIIPQESRSTPTQSPITKSPPSANTISTTSQPLNIDFSKPPPKFDPAMPPPIPIPILSQISSQPPMQTQQIIHQTPQKIIQTTRTTDILSNVDLPPGVEEVDAPPGISQLPSAISRMDFSQPPPTSQFAFPASFIPTSSTFGAPGIQLSLQQPFNSRPPPLLQPTFRHPFGGYHNRFHDRFRGNRGLSRSDDRSSDSDNESGPSTRKKYRSLSRSRSRSPSISKRHKEEKRKDREYKEREGKKKKDKEKKEKHKSHRTSSQKKDKESSSRSIKSERRSSERDKDERESSSRHRSSPRRKEGKSEAIKIKIERRSTERD